jgi:hypothetical protein
MVKERGGEAPRDKAGEPHSPVLLPSGGGFTAFKDLFAPRSPGFEPSEVEGMGRDLRFERREELFASHSLAFASLEGLFVPRSPELARLEEEEAPREREGMPREEEGTRHRRLFARRSPYIAYRSLGGMRPDLLFASLEIRGISHEMRLMGWERVLWSLDIL